MALKNSKKEFITNLENVSGVVSYCADYFEGKGYTVNTEETATGGFISLTKGGMFKAVCGMKTGLNITLTRTTGAVEASMEVGIFGKQAIPAAIAMFAFWPVLIPQIIGLIQQNNLDKEAYSVIEDAIRKYENGVASRSAGSFCPYCGKSIPAGSAFCPGCGRRTDDESRCPSCGAELPKGSAFCPKCGTKIG